MNDFRDAHFHESLFEDINEKYSLIIELVGTTNKDVQALRARLSKIERNTDKIPTIEAAIKSRSAMLKNHEAQFVALRSALQ